MPILSVFFGMIVRMWHDDHTSPHVHVEQLKRIKGADYDD